MSASHQTELLRRLAMAVWPLAVALICYLLPGPGREENYAQSLRRSFGTIQTPPTDQIGSGSLSQTGKSGGAKVFWTQPEPGKLHGTIIIPAPNAEPEKDEEGEAAGEE